MLVRLILAAIAGAVAWLVCIFVGGLLALTGVPIAVFVGDFLKQWAIVISILVAIWYFFAGGGFSFPVRR
jgi:hypothetical protein